MFCTVHCSIVTNKNKKQKKCTNYVYIYFFSICITYMFLSCWTIVRVRWHRVSNTMIRTFSLTRPVSTRPSHSAHTSTKVCIHNNISYYNNYKYTHLTREYIYIYVSFYIVLQDILNIYTQLFNFNINYQYTTRCLDCGEYIYKQLHLK
jgi:hypothetical protein